MTAKEQLEALRVLVAELERRVEALENIAGRRSPAMTSAASGFSK